MSTKKGKTSRSSKKGFKTTTQDGGTEIFVLPPNILQKLGINLGNIETPPVAPGNINGDNLSLSSTENRDTTSVKEYTSDLSKTAKEDETSILETANLMKESVLLSPSFSPAPTNISVELEISSVGESKRLHVTTSQIQHNNKIGETLIFPDEINNEVSQNVTSLENSEEIIENDELIHIIDLVSQNVDENINTEIFDIQPNDDHLDEAYLSDCSNSNLGTVQKDISSNIPDIHSPNLIADNKLNNKINIISEESINLSHLNELNIVDSGDLPVLIPIDVNDIIPNSKMGSIAGSANLTDNYQNCNTQKFDDFPSFSKPQEKTSAVLQITNTELYLSGSKRSHGNDNTKLEPQTGIETANSGKIIIAEKNNDANVISNYMALTYENGGVENNQNILELANKIISEVQNDTLEINENDKKTCFDGRTVGDDFNNVTDSSFPVNNEFKESMNLPNLNLPNLCKDVNSQEKTEKSIMKQNKCIGTSNIPSEKVQEIANYLIQCINPGKDSKKLTKCKDKNMSKNQTKLNSEMSKLCIQGVEKPGGIDNNDKNKKVFKTYKKAHKQTKTHNQDSNIISPEVVEDQYVELNCPYENVKQGIPQFCLCGDFGRFAYYDSDNIYEHIHFWDREYITIDREIIFSIYNNEVTEWDSQNISSISDNISEHDIPKSSLHNICWYNIEEYTDMCPKDLDTETRNKHCDRQLSQFPTTEDAYNNITGSTYIPQSNEKKSEVIMNHDKDIVTSTNVLDQTRDHNSSKHEHTTVQLNVNNPNLIEIKDETMKSENCSIHSEEENNSLVELMDIVPKNHEKTIVYEIMEAQEVENNNISTLTSEELTEFNEVKRRPNKRVKIDKKLKKCGVCKQQMSVSSWYDHIARKHNYLAWEDGDEALVLNDEGELHQHLNKILKKTGGLACSKCGEVRKYVKSYLKHIKNCEEVNTDTSDDDSLMTVKIEKLKTARKTSTTQLVKCGVCSQEVEYSKWIDHIFDEHKYMAWKDGQPPLDFEDEKAINNHLKCISKEIGGLKCFKCGILRKTPKIYMQHITKCGEKAVSRDSTLDSSDLDKSTIESTPDSHPVKCGVCQVDVDAEKWLLHIQKEHNYLAWKDGDSLNLNDSEEVRNYLNALSNKIGGLICGKCGEVRKMGKPYLKHVNSCEIQTLGNIDCLKNADKYTCGVCLTKINSSDWKNHKMKEHYNVAWIVGETPIDIKNPYTVEKYLKEYKDKYKKLTCKHCKVSRVSYAGFFAHVLTCGKTDEETEQYKSICGVCNKPYLMIYHNQHMGIHKEQEYAKQRKLAREKAEETVEEVVPIGKRVAAERARTVIEKYTNDKSYSHTCPQCGYGADTTTELDRHQCVQKAGESDSDDSVSLNYSEPDSIDTDIDSDLSLEEELQPKKKHREQVPLAPKISRLPFGVESAKSYLTSKAKDFCALHFTNEKLFEEWSICQYEAVCDDKLSEYMAPIEESCNVKFGDNTWSTYRRFEARENAHCGISIFVGASIQSIRWAPHPTTLVKSSQFMAVTCHNGPDSPRYEVDEIVSHPAMIQIWDFGDFKRLPKLALGLAHDYGTVWDMDWCPSGARDLSTEYPTESFTRLGLLAVACSNGRAYIFSVPYPSSIVENDKLVYKLKPVVELRLTMGSDRKIYQATTLSWSPQKGHTFVVVGYADGVTAYYDLNCDSPMLKTKENDTTIIYPYHDERPHNASITGVSTYPSTDGMLAVGAVSSSSPTGAESVSRAGVCPARTRSRLATCGTVFPPLWPAAVLAGDEPLVNAGANELEWWGSGRRFGVVTACTPCLYCVSLAVSAPPLIKMLRPHPLYTQLTKKKVEMKKEVLGLLQLKEIRGRKRKIQANDDLATKIEPITYEETVKKYGIEFILEKNLPSDCSNKSGTVYPERFPLADVTSLAFCSTALHHDKLAIALHSGMIFVITV